MHDVSFSTADERMAKKKMASKEHKRFQQVLVPPSRHILTPFSELVENLAGQRSKSGEVREVAQLLDALTLHEFQEVRRRLKHNFRPFAAAAAGLKPRNQSEDLDELEVELLDDLCELLQSAHFKVLTAEEWQSSCDNDFTFTNPLEVAWEHMDQTLMKRFWRRRQDEFVNAAPISERVLVMHRGVHLSRARGMFLEDKIDLLVLYLIAGPCERLFRPIGESLFQGDLTKIWPKFSVVDTVKDAGICNGKGAQRIGACSPQPLIRDPLLEHENAKWVERITLKELMPDARSVFKVLFKELTIQEPTFRDALVLYRRDTTSESHIKDEKAPLKSAKPEDLVRNIHVKRFQDIPIADLEMIFPDKRVYLKPLLLVQLLVTIMIGLASVVVTVLTTEASWSLIGAVLSIIGTRAFQVWSSAQLGRQKVLDQITERLYEQTMDAQDGVIYFLLDQMADQHVKELFLAYMLLLEKGQPMTQQDLDRECEKFLKDHFREAVDFALENSLPVLIQDGLIKRDEAGCLRAVPIDQGREIMATKGCKNFAAPGAQASAGRTLPLLSKLSSKRLSSQADKSQQLDGHKLHPEPPPLGSTGKNTTHPHGSEQEQGSKMTGIKSMFKSLKKDA